MVGQVIYSNFIKGRVFLGYVLIYKQQFYKAETLQEIKGTLMQI